MSDSKIKQEVSPFLLDRDGGRPVISFSSAIPRMPEWRMAQPVNFQLSNGEHIAIVGPNGSGKSMLVDIIIGRHPLLMQEPQYDFSPSTKPLVSDNIKYITYNNTYIYI